MKDFVPEVNAHPFSREEFSELVGMANDAFAAKRREIPPDAERCLQDVPPGSIIITDDPMNQFGMTVVAECQQRYPAKGQQMGMSFLFRWFAIGKAREDGRIDEFSRPTDDGQEEIQEAVFHVAAECPLDAEGQFDESFAGRIRAIVAEEENP
ncbi:MAG: hypothetical protein K8T89_10500 [Planctomycetes bacterium]|nr:hypothetical protein [Planctomycetota bacterium]